MPCHVEVQRRAHRNRSHDEAWDGRGCVGGSVHEMPSGYACPLEVPLGNL